MQPPPAEVAGAAASRVGASSAGVYFLGASELVDGPARRSPGLGVFYPVTDARDFRDRARSVLAA